jgi:DNA mismatch repair protein MutL
LGTLDGTFLICKNEKDLILIDQHAAHERVRFEELSNAYQSGSTAGQTLLIPPTLEVNSQVQGALEEIQPTLNKIGFQMEEFGPRTWRIHSVPKILESLDPRPVLAELAGAHLSGEVKSPFSDKIDQILSTVACHSAVRAHDRLSFEEIESLLTRMDEVDLSANCPHGRPTFIRLGLGEIERLFRRK